MDGNHKDCPKDTPRVTNYVQVACKAGVAKCTGASVNRDEWAFPTACPADAVVPVDAAPSNMGSYKGYTNKFTYSNVKANDLSESTLDFSNESAPMNGWTDSARVGCIFGFAVFGLGILFTVTMITIDMR